MANGLKNLLPFLGCAAQRLLQLSLRFIIVFHLSPPYLCVPDTYITSTESSINQSQ